MIEYVKPEPASSEVRSASEYDDRASVRSCRDARVCRRPKFASFGINLFLLLMALVLGACALEPNFGPVVSSAPPPVEYTVASSLEAGDTLKIIVYGEDALSGAHEIAPDGTLTMPLIGPVRAAGLTRRQIENALTAAYANGHYLREPKVSVADVTYRPIYVLGEVHIPGKYPYTIGLDALTAVATAGGFTYRAKRSEILIRHNGEDAWQKYSLAEPLPVAPGDLIRVPERYF